MKEHGGELDLKWQIDMFHTGDQFMLQSYKIPWLIWIQLLVLLLLLALLFFFALFPSDPDDHHVTVTVTAPSTSSNVFLLHDVNRIQKPLANHHSTPTLLTNRQQRALQGGQNLLIKGEKTTGPSMRREEIEEEDEEEELEASSSLYSHPCHYFQLATVAFLKCFGLDSTSDSPSTRKHIKRKES
ncbi:hypothetical protein VNO77_09833 [Canavalia gladiata]|uniref:Transmembrane protein n=1 Tax=Canavalia gladiata TaxID=3824 RepID=A0AAN9QX88_CANGL